MKNGAPWPVLPFFGPNLSVALQTFCRQEKVCQLSDRWQGTIFRFLLNFMEARGGPRKLYLFREHFSHNSLGDLKHHRQQQRRLMKVLF